MTVTRIFPVIMSGGSGTRMWPLSTGERPKQFHALSGAGTMIEQTLGRLRGRHGSVDFLAPIIIAGESHGALVEEALASSGITPTAIVLEPVGRNTAATAALAALVAQDLDPGARVLLMPADQIVSDPAAFIAAILAAVEISASHIVTFGIAPDGPETGYGYIKQGEALADGAYAVAAFTEKPDRATAKRYLGQGGYSWNAGIFLFDPAVMLGEFDPDAADIRDGAHEALKAGVRTGHVTVLSGPHFQKVRSQPVDIAVMEKTRRAAVVPCSIGWADIGSWSELWRLSPKDATGNVITGSVTLLDGANNLVRGEGIHVSVAGVENLIIVASPDGVLILPRHRAQEVKSLIPGKS